MIEMLAVTENLDLDHVHHRLTDVQRVGNRLWRPLRLICIAISRIEGFFQFLALKAEYPQDNLVPPEVLVDEAWHEHILFTKNYSEICDKVFGAYMHHTPMQRNTTPEAIARHEAGIIKIHIFQILCWIFLRAHQRVVPE